MPRKKKNLTIFNAKVRHTRIAGWKYLHFILFLVFTYALLFSVLTYWAGFSNSAEYLVEEHKFQIKTSHLLVHEIDEDTQLGLTNAGEFGIIHEIAIANTDDVPGEFTVESKLSRNDDASTLVKKATIEPDGFYTFTFLHNRNWPEDEIEAEYTVAVPRKIVTELESRSSERVVVEDTWDWPWPSLPFFDDEVLNLSAIAGAQVLEEVE